MFVWQALHCLSRLPRVHLLLEGKIRNYSKPSPQT
ncbi:hypothetical protein LEMLEM_LOCUS26202 [Lemmus lemmus]